MKFNKRLRVLGVVMAVMAFTPLAAQRLEMSGFVGKDQQVLFTREDPASTKTVTLGPEYLNPECVFHWRVVQAPEGSNYSMSNPQGQQIDFSFGKTPGDYFIEATRVSKYGYQREYVCVTVFSDITLLSSKATYNCFEAGDVLDESMFEFETQPEGYGDHVLIHPDYKTVKPVKENYPFEIQDIMFQIEYDDGTVVDCSNKGKINVIGENGGVVRLPLDDKVATAMTLKHYGEFVLGNPELTQDFKKVGLFASAAVTIATFFCGRDFETPEEALLGIETCGKTLKTTAQITKVLAKAFFLYGWLKKGPGGCNLALYGSAGDLSFDLAFNCCDLKQRPAFMGVLNGNPRVEAGLTFDVGLPAISFPGVGGVYFRGGFVLGVEGNFHDDFIDVGCEESPLILSPYLQGEAGIIAMFLHPKVLSAEFGMYPGAFGELTIGPNSKGEVGVKQLDVRLKAHLECRLVTLGFQRRRSFANFIDRHITTLNFQ